MTESEMTGEWVLERTSRPTEWPRSIATKQAILDAAKQLFTEKGYEATTINDIVAQSGISVGSVYHHFGGKAEVFMALAKEDFVSHAAASTAASAAARARGEQSEVELYLIGARAFFL